jgi:hypothetical protein
MVQAMAQRAPVVVTQPIHAHGPVLERHTLGLPQENEFIAFARTQRRATEKCGSRQQYGLLSRDVEAHEAA